MVLAAAIAGFILSRPPDLGEAVPPLAANHGGDFVYNSRPPTSGNHPTTGSLPHGYSDQPIPAEAAVHSMEHGAVVLWFQPDDPDLASAVNQLVLGLGESCLVAGPYADMDSRVAATAWGRLLALDEFDRQQLREFVDAYRGQTGPEAGVCRTQV